MVLKLVRLRIPYFHQNGGVQRTFVYVGYILVFAIVENENKEKFDIFTNSFNDNNPIIC